MKYDHWQGRQAKRLSNGKTYTCYEIKDGILYFARLDEKYQPGVNVEEKEIAGQWELVTP